MPRTRIGAASRSPSRGARRSCSSRSERVEHSGLFGQANRQSVYCTLIGASRLQWGSCAQTVLEAILIWPSQRAARSPKHYYCTVHRSL